MAQSSPTPNKEVLFFILKSDVNLSIKPNYPRESMLLVLLDDIRLIIFVIKYASKKNKTTIFKSPKSQ